MVVAADADQPKGSLRLPPRPGEAGGPPIDGSSAAVRFEPVAEHRFVGGQCERCMILEVERAAIQPCPLAPADGLDPAERRVMRHLVHAVHAYDELPAGHPAEPGEFAAAMHAVQRVIMARALRRQFPEGWR